MSQQLSRLGSNRGQWSLAPTLLAQHGCLQRITVTWVTQLGQAKKCVLAHAAISEQLFLLRIFCNQQESSGKNRSVANHKSSPIEVQGFAERVTKSEYNQIKKRLVEKGVPPPPSINKSSDSDWKDLASADSAILRAVYLPNNFSPPSPFWLLLPLPLCEKFKNQICGNVSDYMNNPHPFISGMSSLFLVLTCASLTYSAPLLRRSLAMVFWGWDADGRRQTQTF